MNPRRILYLISHPPGRGALAREMLDALLVGAVFDQRVSVLFADDGIYQLLGGAAPESSIARSFAALPTYDVSAVYVVEEDLVQRGLTLAALSVPVRALARADVRTLIAAQEVVMND
jgi:tRNA 2-thiouridine synthesizing protein C